MVELGPGGVGLGGIPGTVVVVNPAVSTVPGTIVITGAAGKVGGLVRPLLLAQGHTLRLFDVVAIADVAPGETFVRGSITDGALLEQAFAGADLVVHLGGLSKEADWDSIVATNVHGGHTVLQSAQRAGVHRVLLASSLHVIGYLPLADVADEPVPDVRPDTYYAVSKITVEALGSLFADRFAMMIISARLGTVDARVTNARMLRTWCSPADLVRLINVCRRRDEPGHHVVWAMSANRRGVVSLAAGRAIGFVPVDDADLVADPSADELERTSYLGDRLAGRVIDADHPLGQPW